MTSREWGVMAFLRGDQVAHLEDLPSKEHAPHHRQGMGRARAERKAETLTGWRTMEIRAGAKRLHFLRGGKSPTVRGGDARPDLLGLPEHRKSSKATSWAGGQGGGSSSALLQIQSGRSLKMPKDFCPHW